MMMGMRIVENAHLVVLDGEDWSRVRSPSRARRRRGKHRQNIIQKVKPDPTVYRINGALVCHPQIAKLLYDKIGAR